MDAERVLSCRPQYSDAGRSFANALAAKLDTAPAGVLLNENIRHLLANRMQATMLVITCQQKSMKLLPSSPALIIWVMREATCDSRSQFFSPSNRTPWLGKAG